MTSGDIEACTILAVIGLSKASLPPGFPWLAPSQLAGVMQVNFRLVESLTETPTIGYVRVSTDKQADHGVSLEAQAEKIRAMTVVHNAEFIDIIVDGGRA